MSELTDGALQAGRTTKRRLKFSISLFSLTFSLTSSRLEHYRVKKTEKGSSGKLLGIRLEMSSVKADVWGKAGLE